ncbi:MAG TPA: hypothetical protein PKA41_16930 [Verrucomicrobiota bacterium]|nr:hypothetical protein [Verrucomicrobiota bacterium]
MKAGKPIAQPFPRIPDVKKLAARIVDNPADESGSTFIAFLKSAKAMDCTIIWGFRQRALPAAQVRQFPSRLAALESANLSALILKRLQIESCRLQVHCDSRASKLSTFNLQPVTLICP